MTVYLSLLRGINVSGQKKIKMAELKQLYESLGYQNVSTYIQSGNVIFSTPESSQKNLKQALEKAIQIKYDFFVPVEIRTLNDIGKTVDCIPFEYNSTGGNPKGIYVTFLSALPDQSDIDKLLDYVKPPEKLIVTERDVYFHCPQSYGKSKLSNNFIENKLGVAATTRNWNTVLKLHEMMNTK